MTLGYDTMIMPIVLLEKLPLNFQNHSIAKKDAASSNASNDLDQVLNHKNSKHLSCSRLRNKRKKRKKRFKTCENSQTQTVSDNLLSINHKILAVKTIASKKLVTKKKIQKEGKGHLKPYGFKFVNNKLTFAEDYLNHLYTPIVVLERLPISNRTKTNVAAEKERLRNLQKEEINRRIEEEKFKKAAEKERLQKIQEEEEKNTIKEEKLKEAAEKERLQKIQKEKERKQTEEEKIKKAAKQERLRKIQEEEKNRIKDAKLKKVAEQERLHKIQEEEEKRKIKEEKLKKASEKERLHKLQKERESKRIEEEKLKEAAKQERLQKLQEEEEKRRVEEEQLKKVVEPKRFQNLQDEEKGRIEKELQRAAEQKQLRKLREEEEKERLEEEQLKKPAEQERLRKLQEEEEKAKKTAEQERLRKLQKEEEKRRVEEEKLKKSAEQERLRKLQEEEQLKKVVENERLRQLQEEEEKRRIEEEKQRQAAEKERLRKLQEEEKRRIEDEKQRKLAEKERLRKLQEEEKKRRIEDEKQRQIVEKERLRKLQEEEKRSIEEEKLRRNAEEERLRKLQQEEKKLRIEEEKLIQVAEQERLQKLRKEEEKRRIEEEKLRKTAEERLRMLEEGKRRVEEERLRKVEEQERLRKLQEKDEVRKLEQEKRRQSAEEDKLRKLQEEEKKRRIEEDKLKKAAELEQLRKLQEEEGKRKIEKEKLKKAAEEHIRKLRQEEEERRIQEEKLENVAEEERIQKLQKEEIRKRIEVEQQRKVEEFVEEQERLQKLHAEEHKRKVAELERLGLVEGKSRIGDRKLKKAVEKEWLQQLREAEKTRVEEQKLRKEIDEETIRQILKKEQERAAEEERLKRIAEEERIKKIIEKERLKIIEEREVLKKVIAEERSKSSTDKQRSRKAIEKALLKKVADKDKYKVKLQIRKILTDSDRRDGRIEVTHKVAEQEASEAIIRAEDTHKVSELKVSEATINKVRDPHKIIEQGASKATINEKDDTEKPRSNLPDEMLNTIKTEPMDDYDGVGEESNVIEQNRAVNQEQFNEENPCIDYVNGSAPIKTESIDNQEDECRNGSMTLQEACEQIANDNICEDNFESSNVCVAGLNSLLNIPNDSDDEALDAEMNGHVDRHFINVNPRPFELNVSSALAKMFNCIKCGQFFKSERSLRDHTRCCMVPPYLECVFCFWKTNRKNTLRKHIKVKHKLECPAARLEPLLVEIFKKSAPLRAIAERAALLDNTLLHNSKNLTLKCDECFETFATKARLQKHIFKRHWRMPIEAQLSNEEKFDGAEIGDEDMDQKFTCEMVTSEDPLEQHTLEKGPELDDRDDELPTLSQSPRSALVESTYGFVLPQETQNFVLQSVTCWCPSCDKWTSAMEKNIKCPTCDTPYIYGCKWCAEQKRNYQLSRIHVIRHHTERIHTCSYCGHSFSYIQDYRHHLKYCVKEKNITCPNANCLFRTKYQRSLKHHLLTCREAKDFRSTESLSYSKSLPELVPIMRINNEGMTDDARSIGNSEYHNNLISQRKRQSNSGVLMENHIPRKKRGLEPLPKLKFYFKKNCLENWTKNGSSSKHKHAKKTSSIMRRYHCYKCGKVYKSNNQLSRHLSCCGKVNMLVSCDHCSFKTVSKSTLVAHIHSKHAARLFRGIEAFSCANCRQVFRNYFIYERHTDKCKKVKF